MPPIPILSSRDVISSVSRMRHDVSVASYPMYSASSMGNAEMTRTPKIECYNIPEDKPAATPNPFKIGQSVRLRDGTTTNGTVGEILGNHVLVTWDGVPGDPKWYHQDFIAAETKTVDRERAPLPQEEPDAKPNPFQIGESVRLRDGTFTNGTVRGMLVDQVLVAWNNVAGDPQWYHQDFIATEKAPPERDRAFPVEEKPTAKPNPFKVGECVRLRDGTFTNGIVKRIFVDQLLVAWHNVAGDPQWYHQDFILAQEGLAERDHGADENRVEQDIVHLACRLVSKMDDNQRRDFIAYIRDTYK